MALSRDSLQKWARGTTSTAATADDLGDKLVNKLADMPPAGDGGEDELGEEGTMMGASDPLWSGDKSVTDIAPEDVEGLLAFLETEEPEIHKALMYIASSSQEADQEAVAKAKEMLMQAQQLNLEYEEFDEHQREIVCTKVVQYMAEAEYPMADSPETSDIIASAIAEARSGSTSEDEDEEEDEFGDEESDDEPDFEGEDEPAITA